MFLWLTTWLRSGNSAWQWQPITTSHDPNPPLTLEDAAVAASDLVPTWWAAEDWQAWDDDLADGWLALVFDEASAPADPGLVLPVLDMAEEEPESQAVESVFAVIEESIAAADAFIQSVLAESVEGLEDDADGWISALIDEASAPPEPPVLDEFFGFWAMNPSKASRAARKRQLAGYADEVWRSGIADEETKREMRAVAENLSMARTVAAERALEERVRWAYVTAKRIREQEGDEFAALWLLMH